MPFLHLLTRRNSTMISRGNLQPSVEMSESCRSTWIFSRKWRGVGGAVTPPSGAMIPDFQGRKQSNPMNARMSNCLLRKVLKV